MIRAVLHGAGRMAEAINACAIAALANPGGAEPGGPVHIAGVVSRNKPAWVNVLPHVPSLDQLQELPDILVDFSLPAGTALAADWCREHRVPLLSGVTGLPPAVLALLSEAAQEAAVLWSPNFSIGVNLLAQFCSRVAAVANPGATVHIEDIHHQWKKDAPSGTSLMLGEAIATHWSAGPPEIDYQSRREGEVIGDHHVRFELAGETITLSHAARDRRIFARGALAAAAWLARQPGGLYTTADWLKA